MQFEKFLDLWSNFHDLPQTDQITRLIYFATEFGGYDSLSQQALQNLFTSACLPVPTNLYQLLRHLYEKERVLTTLDTYKLTRAEKKKIEVEVRVRLPGAVGPADKEYLTPFDFGDRSFSDIKIKTLLHELSICYSQQCWNASGILMRIIIERTLDSVDPAVKNKSGLRAKLNYCISANGLFSKSLHESLAHLQGAKIIGDIAAHHSSILLEKTDIDIAIPHFRMLIKEVKTI